MMKRNLLLAAAVVVLSVITTNHKTSAVSLPHRPARTPIAHVLQVPRGGTKIIYDSTQVPIATKNRIYNKTGSQCGWCSLETLGRHHGIKSLYNLTDAQKSLINSQNGPYELRQRRVKFVYQDMGNKDTKILRKYVTEKQYGAAIGLRGTHMIVLCHYDEKQGIVKVIDNAGPKALQVQTWTMNYFIDLWDGATYVVFPQ